MKHKKGLLIGAAIFAVIASFAVLIICIIYLQNRRPKDPPSNFSVEDKFTGNDSKGNDSGENSFDSQNSGRNDIYINVPELVNNNSHLPVEYMSSPYDIDEDELKDYEYIDNFMSDDYWNEDIAFSYYGYPDDESSYSLGQIEIRSDKYSLLGVTVGDDYEQAIAKIQEYGFELKSKGYFEATLAYGDFSIVLEADFENYNEDSYIPMIETISIIAHSVYLGNNIY